jgi:hypothetical protein
LIASGVSPDYRDPDTGMTLLMTAASSYEHSDLVKPLIEMGADTRATNPKDHNRSVVSYAEPEHAVIILKHNLKKESWWSW